MLTILKSDELDLVSGGWVCSNTYDGKDFYQAIWYTFTPNRNKSYGRCYYGDGSKKLLAIPARDDLTGIVQNPNNYWSFGGDDGGFSRYICHESAIECVFK